MSMGLYDAIIPTWLQMLGAGKVWLDKAAASELPEDKIAQARLIEDMLPFAYQVKSMVVHSIGAIEGVRGGLFEPDRSDPPETLQGMHSRIDAAIAGLEAVTRDELESFIGREMRFEVKQLGKRLDFTADQFLLTFSQPNFFFHATTAYAILRMKGVPIGKIDYLGQMRMIA